MGDEGKEATYYSYYSSRKISTEMKLIFVATVIVAILVI